MAAAARCLHTESASVTGVHKQEARVSPMIYRSRTIVLVTILLFGLAATACSRQSESGADLVITNGAIYTVNDAQPWAEAVAVRNGEIVYVGDIAGAENLVGKNTQRIDLDGKFMLPGFVDSHMHLIEGAGFFNALSLDTYGSIDDWLVAIEDHVRANADAP
ncbi:MAG TPA: amidohydrolase family protein, partial [Woeseiaceae bacterium]